VNANANDKCVFACVCRWMAMMIMRKTCRGKAKWREPRRNGNRWEMEISARPSSLPSTNYGQCMEKAWKNINDACMTREEKEKTHEKSFTRPVIHPPVVAAAAVVEDAGAVHQTSNVASRTSADVPVVAQKPLALASHSRQTASRTARIPHQRRRTRRRRQTHPAHSPATMRHAARRPTRRQSAALSHQGRPSCRTAAAATRRSCSGCSHCRSHCCMSATSARASSHGAGSTWADGGVGVRQSRLTYGSGIYQSWPKTAVVPAPARVVDID
jgi:hypothetical protein